MKKSMMTLVFMLVAMVMSAQTSGVKISAKYKKGDNMLYRMTAVTNVMGKSINLVSETRFVVTEASSKGYVIENTLEKMESDAAPDDLVGRMMNATTECLKGVKTIVVTDADGKVTGIKNIEEINKKTGEYLDKVFDELFAQLPAEATQILTKDKLKATVMEQMTETNLIKSMIMQPSPLALNGLTISTGSTDTGVDVSGFKLKNTYTLVTPDATKVKVVGKSEMTKDDMKKMIIDQVKKLMPEQAAMIEQNIDMVMQNDAFKMDKEQTADYEFGKNGWIKTITYSSSSSNMGQSSDMNGKMELVESNR